MRRTAVSLDAARLAVVEPAGQLAHDEHVGACEHLGLERTCRLRGSATRGPAAGWRTGRAPSECQAAPLRAGADERTAIERRIADGAEQDRIGRSWPPRASSSGSGGRLPPQRRARRSRASGSVERVAEPGRDRAQDLRRAGDDLRADAVARKEKDDCVHGERFYT